MNEKNRDNSISEDVEKELSIDDLDQINGGSPTTSTSNLNADQAGHTTSPRHEQVSPELIPAWVEPGGGQAFARCRKAAAARSSRVISGVYRSRYRSRKH